MSTAQDNSLPKKLWCYMGEHWQVRERFSKNQKAKYLNALRRTRVPMNNKDIKALNMACQVHSGQPVVEFKCHGPCSLYKHRDRFSKSQRRNRLRWCLDCVAWRSQFDIGDVPVAHPNEDLSQADVAGDPADAPDDSALLEKYPFDFDLDEDIQDDDLGGADDMGSDSEDDAYLGTAAAFNGYSDSDDDEDDYYETPVLPAKSASRGQTSRTDIGQRLGNMSIREPSNTATSTMSSRQATVTRDNTPGQKMSPSITSTGKGTSSKQSVSTTGTNRTVQANTPTFAGCTPGFVPPHLQAARAGNGGYTNATGTSSIVSSDSRAGITNASMYSTTASRKGTGAMRSSGGPTSTAATTQTGRAADNPRRRPDRNGWARPDMRRTFDKQAQFATSAADYIETHESGSEDEI
ncbi:hypothetical protein PG996_003588 [Apiospora saccharicola]|uniref:Stc1 domain-containing protein n=1 Tax=Apiospora saccharicola TaxID=335842 RepID=A0ABR1W5J2_9PEZI